MLFHRRIRGEVETALRRCIAASDLGVIERRNGGVTWLLLAPHGYCLSDGYGPEWNLYRLPIESTAREYWCGLRIRFDGRQDRELASASIIVAAGILQSCPVPLARAEWDATATTHAQPHWHIYRVGREVERPARPELQAYEVAEDSARVHWAMAAQWAQLGNVPAACAYSFADADALAKWCSGCLGYLLNQLKYLESRFPQRRNYFEGIRRS